MIGKYMLTKKEQYEKCFNENYFESCKIAKKNADHPSNTCDDLDWDANTRFNVALNCRKLTSYNPFNKDTKEPSDK
jgi:hypothetical protein